MRRGAFWPLFFWLFILLKREYKLTHRQKPYFYVFASKKL